MTELLAEIRIPDLSDRVFQRVVALAYDVAGIRLGPEKRELVKSRLIKRVRQLSLAGFDEYLEYVDKDATGQELPRMIDVLTTNKTNFFREDAHFDFLKRVLLPEVTPKRRLRIWSAACSTGEEPYTIGIVLREAIPDVDAWDVKILASDISARVLEHATRGVYRADQVAECPAPIRTRYFTNAPGGGCRVADNVRKMVNFARLNLMADWPMRGPFDMIFCRNVMIYFDRPTQEKLVGRFYELIRPGGYLAVGHSESLTPVKHSYEFVQPATYRRPG